MMSRPKVIRGGLAATFGPSGWSGHRDILVVGDRIAEIGPPGLAAPEGAEIVDATNRLLIPGLVNAHAHTHLVLAKSMAREWSLELHLNAGPYTSGNRTHEERSLSAKLLAVELIRNGCTACYDMFTEQPVPSVEGVRAVAHAYLDIGIRAVIAPLMADRLFWNVIPGLAEKIPPQWRQELDALEPPGPTAWIDAYRRVLEQWTVDRDMVRPAMAPLIPHHCSDELLVMMDRLAQEHALSLHIHLAESKVQAVAGLELYGTTLTRHLGRLGLISERLIAGHAIWVDDDDIRRLAGGGAMVTHNPTSNLRLGSGLARVRHMRDAGIAVGIGTDTPSCSDDLNMFLAMRCAAYIARAITPDFTRWLDADAVLSMATVEGARILGRDDIGSLTTGFKADIVFLDLDSTTFIPLNDIAHQLVYGENGSSVDSVMIGGRMILERGQLKTVDERRLRTEAQQAVERLARANAGRKALSARLEPIVAAHCSALSRRDYPVRRHVENT
ncbi:MAG: amidohydrolase family protein [Hyphomicrobiaceae bacterium]